MPVVHGQGPQPNASDGTVRQYSVPLAPTVSLRITISIHVEESKILEKVSKHWPVKTPTWDPACGYVHATVARRGTIMCLEHMYSYTLEPTASDWGMGGEESI